MKKRGIPVEEAIVETLCSGREGRQSGDDGFQIYAERVAELMELIEKNDKDIYESTKRGADKCGSSAKKKINK